MMRSSFLRHAVILGTVVVAATATSTSPFAQQSSPPSVFRSRLNLISVDVIVRDTSGAVASTLTASDFEVREDGRPQNITKVNIEQITDNAKPGVQSADFLAG